jgi:hypothetical protein
MKILGTAFLPLVFVAGLTSCPSVELPPTADAVGQTGSLKVSIFPTDVTLRRGELMHLSVRFDRPEGSSGPVTLEITDLPAGVSVERITVPRDSNRGELILHATESTTPTTVKAAVVEASIGKIKAEVPIRVTVSDVSADGSDVRATLSADTVTQADTRPFQAHTAYANFQGSICQVMASQKHRNIEVCLAKPHLAETTYALVDSQHFGSPGTASITYFQTEQAVGSANVSDAPAGFWDSISGTLRLEAATNQVLEFRVENAVMAPATNFARNTAIGAFTLELSAHIENVSNLR